MIPSDCRVEYCRCGRVAMHGVTFVEPEPRSICLWCLSDKVFAALQSNSSWSERNGLRWDLGFDEEE